MSEKNQPPRDSPSPHRGSDSMGDSPQDSLENSFVHSLRAALQRAHQPVSQTDSPKDSPQQKTGDSITTVAAPGLFASAEGPNQRWAKTDSLQPGRRYEIVRLHAEGGLGAVYVAKDLELGREVALKQIRAERADQADMQSRFLQEAEITGRLEHPGVVPVYGFGVDSQGRPYYAMRWIRGQSLKQAIEEFHQQSSGRPAWSLGPRADTQNRLALRKLLQSFVAVCHALEYAHNRGVIHRDVKPDNIMLGKYGETLVVDWGLAKAVGRDEDHSQLGETTLYPESGDDLPPTQLGSAVGTPAYMSPEQAAGMHDQARAASDIYSLGATLYHLLTGSPPHKGQTLATLLQSIQRGDFPRPRQVLARTPKLLEAICLKAMALAPEDRYASAGELAADIERWLADEPVAAHPEGFVERAVRWTRRHRAAVVSASLLLVLASIAAAVTMVLSERAAHHQQRRISELASSAAANEELALAELKAGRFKSALAACQLGRRQTEQEPSLASLHERLEKRRRQLERLVTFEELSFLAQEHSVSEADEQARIDCETALDALGVFDHGDWWAHLPDQDLTAVQRDKLRQSAYFQLLYLAHIYGKDVVLKFTGARSETAAQSVLQIVRRAQGFRSAQSLQFLTDLARFRLKQSKRFPLVPEVSPHNEVDQYFVAAAIFIVARNPYVAALLRTGKRFSDPLREARDQYRRAAARLEDHYWTHWTLGYCEMLLENYQAARLALSYCIALRPDYYPSYGLRSEAFLKQAEAMMDSGESSSAEKSELILLALRDAEKARELAPDQFHIYWYLGRALFALDRKWEATQAFLKATELGPPADVPLHHRFINVHRTVLEETQQRAEKLVEQAPNKAEYWELLADVRRALNKYQTADAAAQRALQLQPSLPRALVVRGERALQKGRYKQAKDYFDKALTLRGDSFLATRGLAQTYEGLGLAAGSPEGYADKALAAFSNASNYAVSPWHIADAQAGRCRALLSLDRPDEAIKACRTALSLDHRVSVEAIKQIAQRRNATKFLAALSQMRPQSPLDRQRSSDADHMQVAPLLNGGFELGLSKYWSPVQQGKPIWWNQQSVRSTAQTVTDMVHQGERCLWIKRHTPAAKGAIASMQQVFPIQPGVRYRVTVWAKAENMARDGVQIVFADPEQSNEKNRLVVSLPAGNYDWRSLQGEFTPTTRQVALRIVSQNQGQAWIDDIRVEKLEK